MASRKSINLLNWVMGEVLYWCNATATKMASKVGAFFIIVLFAVALAAAGAIQSK